MKLVNIYKSDINRDINGVIKVAQDDEASIKQELSEYIITRELKKHFDTFLTNYEKSLDYPTDKIGVWISGFFGSGKSHFLKILSYLLSNKTIGGKQAISYFTDKFDDPMAFAQLERCASVPTETILFNIDSKSSINKDNTAILRVFAKVFYEHLGFYGNDLKLAKLEQFIAKEGKMDAFKAKFKDIHFEAWEDCRDAYTFFEDDVVEALVGAVGMSEIAARNWFNGSETAEISIEQLVKEIKEYVDSRGKNFRLLFMIDEVGQYIGSDVSLMLNLQTIVEEIGSKCGGRVWVMVTSQEAIDSITKIAGDDFSKITGRFNTRMSLSSSSVDEVIKKRILAKNKDAEDLLRMQYDKYSADLRNRFTFSNSVLDLKGYAGPDDYIETYPFVPYQFRLMQNVLAQIRKHGNSGKHLAGGERSMLSGFQEVAQSLNEKDESALAPFYLFYDTVHTFLESTIRRVIDRCQLAADSKDGLEPFDVNTLKLLYLIRYVDDIKSSVENIATLMVDDINVDIIVLRKNVQESLDRLVKQNYVARSGDTYAFLTDDEQDIAKEIKNTSVDTSNIVASIASTIFNEIYMTKKFSYGQYNFPFDQCVDETFIGPIGSNITLRVVTVASDLYQAGEQALVMKSGTNNEAIVVLSDLYPYFDELTNAAKIRKYVKSKNVSQLPESIQAIIRSRQLEATAYEKRAKEYITDAIMNGRFFVKGSAISAKGSNVKDKFEYALSLLVENVYTELGQINKFFASDADLLSILANDQISIDNPNSEAEATVMNYLELQEMKNLPTSMGDIQKRFSSAPYGWREIEIAGVVASLIAQKRVQIKYSGAVIQPSDKKIPDYLRKKFDVDKTIVEKRKDNSKIKEKARAVLREYLNVMDVPTDEDDLIAFIVKKLEKQSEEYNALLNNYVFGKYPDKEIVEKGVNLIGSVLAQKKDNAALFNKIVDVQDDLYDFSDDVQDVYNFFATQKGVFDSARKMVESLDREKEYLQAEKGALADIARIETILNMPRPYSYISELPDLVHDLRTIYDSLLASKKEDVTSLIQGAMAEIHQAADEIKQAEIIAKADFALNTKQENCCSAEALTQLDALQIQIASVKQQYLKALMASDQPDVKVARVSRASIGYVAKLKSEAEIDNYLSDIKKDLLEKLAYNDELQII